MIITPYARNRQFLTGGDWITMIVNKVFCWRNLMSSFFFFVLILWINKIEGIFMKNAEEILDLRREINL